MKDLCAFTGWGRGHTWKKKQHCQSDRDEITETETDQQSSEHWVNKEGTSRHIVLPLDKPLKLPRTACSFALVTGTWEIVWKIALKRKLGLAITCWFTMSPG